MMNLITLQCKREATTHIRVGLNENHIVLLYGTIEDGEFVQSDGEGLLLNDNPEFRELHDGTGWNVAALQALVIDSYCGEDC